MSYTLPNLTVIEVGDQFELDGVTYPSNWIGLASPEELLGLGITEVPVVPPTSAELLSSAMLNSLKELYQSYQTAIQQPVAYMGKQFQADLSSQDTLAKAISGMSGTAPSGFYWVAADNSKVSMDFTQVQGLAASMFAQAWPAFQNLQDKKALVEAATTVAEVQAVTW